MAKKKTTKETTAKKPDLSKILGREDILMAKDLRERVVEVPEWDGSVIVRAMTARDRDIMEQHIEDMRGEDREVNLANMRATVVALVVVNKKGNRIFTSKADLNALGGKSAAAIERIFDVAVKMNRMSESDVEELIKN